MTDRIEKIAEINRQRGDMELRLALLNHGIPAIIAPEALTAMLTHPDVRLTTTEVHGLTVQYIHLRNDK